MQRGRGSLDDPTKYGIKQPKVGEEEGSALERLPSPCQAAGRVRARGSGSSLWGEGPGPPALPQLFKGCRCDPAIAVPEKATSSAVQGCAQESGEGYISPGCSGHPWVPSITSRQGAPVPARSVGRIPAALPVSERGGSVSCVARVFLH